MADNNTPVVSGPTAVKCPTCKATNEPGVLTCKKCGDIMPKKPKKGKGEFDEYDGTVGTMSPACIAVPVVLLVLFAGILLLSIRGPREGSCAAVRLKIGTAIIRFDKAHPNAKMATLNVDDLLKPDSKGHPCLPAKPTCPIDPSARYEFDAKGTIVCTKCGHK